LNRGSDELKVVDGIKYMVGGWIGVVDVEQIIAHYT